MRKLKSAICSNYCDVCEGQGYIVTGLASKFDAKNMELVDYDVREKCPNNEGENMNENEVDFDIEEQFNKIMGDSEKIDKALKEFQDAFKIQDEVTKKIMGAFNYE
jgi:methylase of polypeptide subunit release factors